MAESRRQTRSAGARRQNQESDAHFWNTQPDTVMIERGQTEAIQLVQGRMNPTAANETARANTTDSFRVPPMVFVDDEGLKEQFLTDEASQEVADITANRVTTPTENNAATLDPIYTQRSQRDEDLDLQPSRGPREESLVNALDQYLGDDYEDILENGRDKLPECDQDLNHNGYVLNCIHDGRPLTLNDIARPVFVNHYYAGEPLVPVSLSEQITNKDLTENILQFFSNIPTTSHALNKLRMIRQGSDEPIVNYNKCYQNLPERVEGCPLDSIMSTVTMELYLGSIIEPIRKSICNTLYFNSKHAPKTLGEVMQKAQNLHIKHLNALGEDQQDSTDTLPEIMVNEVTSHEDRRWYRNKCKFREHFQNSWKSPQQPDDYMQKMTFNQRQSTRGDENSKYRELIPDQVLTETDKDKVSQQPSVIRGSFTQIMVNPMQLQDQEFTAWLDRLMEARKNRQEKRQRPYRNYRKLYNDGKQPGDRWTKPPLQNRIKPAKELEVQQIMDNFNCEYNDVVEVVDLYNFDVEECMTA